MPNLSQESFLAALNAHQNLKPGPDYWYCGDCDAFIAEGDMSSFAAEAAYRAHQAAEVWKIVEENTKEEWNAGFDGGHPDDWRTVMDLKLPTLEALEASLNKSGYVIGERNYFPIHRRLTEWHKGDTVWGPPGWGPRDQQD